MHHIINLFMHHIVPFVLYFFCANLQYVLGFIFVLFPICWVLLVLNSSTMPRKTRANMIPSTPSVSPSRVQLFRNEHFVILDEVDPAIKANLESRGWLSLLEIDHPPQTALIREFFSNLSCHIYDSNTVVRSWIRGVEFTITPRVVA